MGFVTKSCQFKINKILKRNEFIREAENLHEHILLDYTAYIHDFAKALENEILNSYLLITDQEGTPIHQFVTGEKLNGIAFDTFFLVENRLYYIAYKNTLSAICL